MKTSLFTLSAYSTCSYTIQFVDSTYITFRITHNIFIQSQSQSQTNTGHTFMKNSYTDSKWSLSSLRLVLFHPTFSPPYYLLISPNSTKFFSVSLLFPIKFSASPLFIRFKHVTRPFLKNKKKTLLPGRGGRSQPSWATQYIYIGIFFVDIPPPFFFSSPR